MAYSLVLPFHSDLTSIVSSTQRARDEGHALGIREVILAHNGRELEPAAKATIEALVAPATADKPEVRFLHTDAKGIGAGYKLGIAAAREEFVVLSADDLCFGWTDVRAFERAGRPDFAIGSKAHPESQLRGIVFGRRVSTLAFRLLRMLVLGPKTPGDSQGTLIIRTALAKALGARVQSDHYLASLELATLQLEEGGSVVEVPITNEDEPHPSSVSVGRDGWRMFKELIELRRRVRRA